jgi:acetyl esterase/lipase
MAKRARRGRFAAAFGVFLACVSAAVAVAARTPRLDQPLGSGADAVWVLRPAGPVRDIVVFGHGWSTPLPSEGFAPWISHLRARGSIVIYPRYRVSAAEPTASALAAFRQGLVTAFRSLGALHVPVVALGKSFGASAVFYYAAEARSWGVPAPRAVISIFPALPIDGVLPDASLPASDTAEIFVGAADTVAGSAGADAFWSWLAQHPSAHKRYIVVRSRPGFVADHNSAQRSDPIARAIFWRPLDALIAALSTRTAK